MIIVRKFASKGFKSQMQKRRYLATGLNITKEQMQFAIEFRQILFC